MKIFPFTATEISEIKRKPALILVFTAICLAGIRFYSGAYKFEAFAPFLHRLNLGNFANRISFYIDSHPDNDLWQLVYWVCGSTFFYVIIPILLIKFVFRESIANYGLKLKGMFQLWKTYAFMFSIIFPVVVMVSFSKEFQNTYPFYGIRSADKLYPQFLIWEAFYILQFFALEFFFRGFMVLGLKPYMGIYSVFAMTVPYCMIHFSKPLPECIGSIFAGVILGLMSYKTGSVWLGAALHVAVALSMDFLSLYHKGLFG